MEYLQIALPITATILGLVLTWLAVLAVKKFKLNALEAESLKALASGVADTYQIFVKGLKLGGKKMTELEKKQAKEMAKKLALDLLKGKARNFLETMWSSRKDQIIESLVSKFKREGKK